MREVYPDLSAMLVALLTEDGESDLAARALDLRIVARCGCGDDFCQSLRTAPKPDGGYGSGHRNVLLSPPQGSIILDVVCDEIMFVELLSLPRLQPSPVSGCL